LALAAPARAWAWGPIGHRVTAEIAQRHLSPKAAAAVARLLNGRTLADVANWADELRDDPRFDKYKALHFATVPDGTAHYADTKKNPCGDLVLAIQVLSDFLRTGAREPLARIKALTQTPDPECNPVVTDPLDAASALALLVHFVGDLHQPLHVGGADAGGNAVKVQWLGADTNLHAVWDSDLIAIEGLGHADFARFLDHSSDAERDRWKRSTVEECADEAVAMRPALYRFPDLRRPGEKRGAANGPAPAEVTTLQSWGFVFPLGYGYAGAHRDQVRAQLLKSGIRLAHLLNQIFQ
jgi:hypothetical protein